MQASARVLRTLHNWYGAAIEFDPTTSRSESGSSTNYCAIEEISIQRVYGEGLICSTLIVASRTLNLLWEKIVPDGMYQFNTMADPEGVQGFNPPPPPVF